MVKTESVMKHNLIMEERSKIQISGVTDIDSFTESRIVLNTIMGELVINGEDLHISELVSEVGDFSVYGKINGIVYSTFKSNAGLLRRIFR